MWGEIAMLSGIRKLHFIGIGGVGMSALAHILLDKGWSVSGSDLHDTPLTRELAAAGAEIYTEHRAENVIDKAVDAIVVSTAIRPDNPEVMAAEKLGIKKLHRSDINALLLNAARGIAVAGAHGKTTTTSMLGVVLTAAGVDPTVIVGGVVRDFGSNARLGKSDVLVTEADESDGSFLKLRPHIAVVTNVEDDHLDYYGTVEKIQAAFKKFMETVDEKAGRVVVCYDNEVAKMIAGQVSRTVVSYGINDGDYRASDIVTEANQTTFTVSYKGEVLGKAKLLIPGLHNVRNALATIAVARELGVTFEKAAAGLMEFHGAKRRFETKGKVNGIWIVDDYAHHPTEIASTISAAKQTKPGRLIVAFQPHRYSRTQLLAKEFGVAFRGADILLLNGIYSAGEDPIEGVSGRTIYDSVLAQTDMKPIYVEDRAEVAGELAKLVQPGDLVLTMGAGDIVNSGEELLGMLEAEK